MWLEYPPFVDARSVTGVVLVSLLAVAPAAGAASAVPTPLGTFYTTVDVDSDDPDVGFDSQDLICIGGGGLEETCVPLLFPRADPGTSATLVLHEESNGCPGLQEERTVCPQSERSVPPDRRIFPPPAGPV